MNKLSTLADPAIVAEIIDLCRAHGFELHVHESTIHRDNEQRVSIGLHDVQGDRSRRALLSVEAATPIDREDNALLSERVGRLVAEFASILTDDTKNDAAARRSEAAKKAARTKKANKLAREKADAK